MCQTRDPFKGDGLLKKSIPSMFKLASGKMNGNGCQRIAMGLRTENPLFLGKMLKRIIFFGCRLMLTTTGIGQVATQGTLTMFCWEGKQSKKLGIWSAKPTSQDRVALHTFCELP